jgi:hypothetical protein
VTYKINFQDDFDDHAWEVEAKGWIALSVEKDSKTVALTFYDHVRLRQEIDDAIAESRVFFETNIVVVPSVTRANIERAVNVLDAQLR